MEGVVSERWGQDRLKCGVFMEGVDLMLTMTS